ncbi:hypothetical protein LRR81_02810 [Metabacillus sp. GX 13764]|uniref:hypothetical protein n=1 Tax=Metabacillus kandeliae TaxID=2900151 RepID=UPI001E637D5A|nr:hypothetical protein [Metabacillus kandeliae]MCD7033145.1 hypothetical protein [Metabacillus kandeliae]
MEEASLTQKQLIELLLFAFRRGEEADSISAAELVEEIIYLLQYMMNIREQKII